MFRVAECRLRHKAALAAAKLDIKRLLFWEALLPFVFEKVRLFYKKAACLQFGLCPRFMPYPHFSSFLS